VQHDLSRLPVLQPRGGCLNETSSDQSAQNGQLSVPWAFRHSFRQSFAYLGRQPIAKIT